MLQNPENITQDQFLKDVDNLKLRFPVARIAEATGFDKGSISKYLKGDMPPSAKFLKKFYGWLEESGNKVEADKAANDKAQDAIIDMLILRLAKLESKVYELPIETVVYELEQNVRILLKQIEKG